jgi:outer membrane protein insertion porin family
MIHRPFARIFLVITAFLLTTHAQTINQVRVEKNVFFDESSILRAINVQLPFKFNETLKDTLSSIIEREMQNNGYFISRASVRVDSTFTDSVVTTLHITVFPGKQAELKEIHYNTVDSLLLNKFNNEDQFLCGQVFTKKAIEDYLATLLDYFQNCGYPFASFKIRQTSYDSLTNAVTLHINCSTGSHCKIDQILTEGNKNTKDYVILRELPIKDGEEYMQSKIDKIPEVLNKTKLFESVSDPQYFISNSNKGILVVTVKEKNTNSFDGIIGYQPGYDNNSKGYLTGLINIGFQNLLGTGRSTSIHWQKLDRLSSELELKYLEPWVAGYPFNINLSFYQKQQDSTYVQRQFESSFEYIASNEITLALQYGLSNVIPSILSSNTFTVFRSTTSSAGFKIKVDNRDDPLSPRRGLYFSNTYTYDRKKVLENTTSLDVKENNEQQKMLLDLSMYFEFFNKQVLAVSIHGKELRGDLIEVSDLYKLGGATTLRGYRENQFLGQRVAWLNTEYRFLLEKRSFAFLFIDNGYYLQKANSLLSTSKSEGYKMGYGLGLAFESGLGIINVSFALAKGNGFSQGMIHFGLANEF